MLDILQAQRLGELYQLHLHMRDKFFIFSSSTAPNILTIATAMLKI